MSPSEKILTEVQTDIKHIIKNVDLIQLDLKTQLSFCRDQNVRSKGISDNLNDKINLSRQGNEDKIVAIEKDIIRIKDGIEAPRRVMMRWGVFLIFLTQLESSWKFLKAIVEYAKMKL